MVLGTERVSWISIRAVVALPAAPSVTVPVPNGRDRVTRATAGPAAPESIVVSPVYVLLLANTTVPEPSTVRAPSPTIVPVRESVCAASFTMAVVAS